MNMNNTKTIWTIGHSTRSIETFQQLLQVHEIKFLADIRTHPGSRKYPHFNKEVLCSLMQEIGVRYEHFPELGGRRKPKADSGNTAWRHASFKGYADHMETEEFKRGIENLQHVALKERVAYMCSELVWWKCHRSLVSDYLKVSGWMVYHIMDGQKVQEHPYTSPAREVQGKLFYN